MKNIFSQKSKNKSGRKCDILDKYYYICTSKCRIIQKGTSYKVKIIQDNLILKRKFYIAISFDRIKENFHCSASTS